MNFRQLKLVIFVFLTIIGEHCAAMTDAQQEDTYEYRIDKIMNKNDWYIIYATRNDSIFKIVSKKNEYKNRHYNKIKRKNKYKLNLYPTLGGPILGYSIVTDLKLSAKLDSITDVDTEPENGINIVYRAYNLDGLYYIPDGFYPQNIN